MNEFSYFVPNVHFEQIPIKNLVSNQEYQRNLSRAHINRAAAHFDLYQINPVKVSRRDGINYVFNGQHTIEIVALVSGSRDTPVWCMIYDDLCYEHEADIFANQMKYVKALSAYEIFMANIEAGNDDQLMIRDLVESYNLKVSAAKAPGNICAISALEMIFTRYGYHCLNRFLRLIIGAWEGDENSFSANIMKAVAKLVIVYGDMLDDEMFKEKLGAISIKSLSRTAKEIRSGSLGYAEAMVIEYNGKKKTSAGRLPISMLYAKSLASLDAVIENETPYEINDDALGKAPTDETDVDDNTDANDDEE